MKNHRQPHNSHTQHQIVGMVGLASLRLLTFYWHVPRRLTQVAPSPVRRTNASARVRWKLSCSVRVARGCSGPRPPAAPAGLRQTHSSHAIAGGGGCEVHPPGATPGPWSSLKVTRPGDDGGGGGAPECQLCLPSDGMACSPVDLSRPVVRPDCSPMLLMSRTAQQGIFQSLFL